jgi:hypothetical protein
VTALRLEARRAILVAERDQLLGERRRWEAAAADGAADAMARLQAQLAVAASQAAWDDLCTRMASADAGVQAAKARSDGVAHTLQSKLNTLSHQMRRQLALALIQQLVRLRLGTDSDLPYAGPASAAPASAAATVPAVVPATPAANAPIETTPVPAPGRPEPPAAAAPTAPRLLTVAYKLPGLPARVLDVAASSDRFAAVDRGPSRAAVMG